MFSNFRRNPAARTLARICAFLALLFAVWPLFAGEAIFFPLVREGSASAILDPDTHTAYLVDGGQQGSLVERPLLKGRPVLSYLRSNDFDTLIIVCSHPHSDHLAGLLQLVKYKGPDDLSHFKRVIFVDSNYPAKSSLSAAYEETHGKRPEHESATDQNAFAELRKRNLVPEHGSVAMDNFPYKPFEGKGPHGFSVVSEYSLVEGSERANVVDFDDADSSVVAKWAEEHSVPSGKGPTVYVSPHHNSDLTDIAPLLNENHKPSAVIFSVNADNRFLHPGPKNWKKWIDAVGLQNIHITGLGSEVRVGSKGVPPLSGAELDRVPREIIEPMLRRLDIERTQIRELSLTPLVIRTGADLKKIRERKGVDTSPVELASLAGVSLGQIRTWESSGSPIPDAERQKLAVVLRRQEVNKAWAVLQEDRQNLQDVNHAYKGDSNLPLLMALAVPPPEFDDPGFGGYARPEDPEPGPTTKSPRPPTGPGPEGKGGPKSGPDEAVPLDAEASGGTLNFKKLQDADAFALLSGLHPSDGTMNFKTLQQRTAAAESEASKRTTTANADKQAPGAIGSSGPEAASGSISRVERFEISTSGEAIFGGVVIGNRVHLEDGWKLISAHIQESSVEGQDPSPEIILTVERNGVIVDRSYSNMTSDELWSAYHVVRPLDAWKQEYDVRDQDSGMIGISDHTWDGPEDKKVDTGWMFGIHPALANTLLAQDGMRLDMTLARLAVRDPGSTSPISPASIKLLNEAPYWSSYQWFDSPSIVKVSEGSIDVVAETDPTNILLRLRYIPAGLIVYPLYHSLTSSQRETQTSNELAKHLTQELDYVRRIDRFAKTVAVLNLIADTSGVSFPALPPEIVRPYVPVTAALTYAAEDKLLGLGVDRSQSDPASWLDNALVVTILLIALAVFLIVVRYLYRRLRGKGRKPVSSPVSTGAESAEHPI